MNNRREFREIVKMSREGSAQKYLLPKLFGALRLFILFFLFSSNAFAQNIQNQQYDINDPRNPNCPCHKLQKLADDEYQRIQNNNNDNEQRQFAMNFNNFNKFDNNDNPQRQLLNVNNFDDNGNDNSSHQVKRDFNFKSEKSSTGSEGSGLKAKKRKLGLEFYKKLNRAKLKHSKIKKVRPNYAVCYKW